MLSDRRTAGPVVRAELRMETQTLTETSLRFGHTFPAPAITVTKPLHAGVLPTPKLHDGLMALLRYSDAKGKCFDCANRTQSVNHIRRPSTPSQLGSAPSGPQPAPRPSHDRRTSEKLGRFGPPVIDFEIYIAVAATTDTRCSGVDNLPVLPPQSLMLLDFAAWERP